MIEGVVKVHLPPGTAMIDAHLPYLHICLPFLGKGTKASRALIGPRLFRKRPQSSLIWQSSEFGGKCPCVCSVAHRRDRVLHERIACMRLIESDRRLERLDW